MLYIIPPLSCPELCRRSKARLGGYCDTPNFSLLTPNSHYPPLPPPFQEGAQFASVRADFWDLRDSLFSFSKDFGI